MDYGSGRVADRRPTAHWWIVTTIVLAVAVEFCCAAVVWSVASDGAFENLLLVAGSLLGLAVLWAICTLYGSIRYRTHLLSAVAPALVIATAVVVYSGAAERVGWQVSKGSLEAAAAECAARSEPQRIGVYTIERMERTGTETGGEGTECRFYTGGGFLDPVGFAYLPVGPPPERPAGETTYRHYDGSWYRFVVSW